MNFSKHFYRISFAILILAIIFDSCTDQRLTTQPAPGASPKVDAATFDNISSTGQTLFNKTVGAPIDNQTGLRWIKNFTNANPSNVSAGYIIQASTLKGILSNSSCVGICLYYGVDNSGQVIIIPVGINTSGKVIAQSVAIQSSTVNWQTAQQLIDNYSGKIKAHFFGSNTFNRLLTDQNSPSIRILPALDDSGNPQLLMSNVSVFNPTSYEDDSIVCPPICPPK